jgi:hypothetical protein
MDIRGFRSATFGMTPAQVRAAITRDLGAGAKIEETANALQGTTAIVATVPSLDPGPGQAQVSYIFGASSKVLTNINVFWATPGVASDAERNALIAAGQQLTAYFQSQPAPVKASPGPSANGAEGVILYVAIDKKNAGVQVALNGVSPDGKNQPKTPSSLMVTYVQDADHPDVKTLRAGSF